MIPLLLLLSGSWLSLKQSKDRRAGALLGLSLALKLMGLPILLFLAIRRRWGAVLPAVVTVAVANLFCVPLMGLSPVLKYYFIAPPRQTSHCGQLDGDSLTERGLP